MIERLETRGPDGRWVDERRFRNRRSDGKVNVGFLGRKSDTERFDEQVPIGQERGA